MALEFVFSQPARTARISGNSNTTETRVLASVDIRNLISTMELEPTTECGKLLYSQLKNWISSSPHSALDALHRLFIMYASKLENQDTFVDALYGQRVLDREQHWELVRRLHRQNILMVVAIFTCFVYSFCSNNSNRHQQHSCQEFARPSVLA